MAGSPESLVRHIRRWVTPPASDPATDAALLDRFLANRDEAAFAALVARHGPMVLRVCRRVLGNAHDAEEAFQAAFLVLARKAVSIRPSEPLAGWLHGVAHRVALKARAARARRLRKAQPLAAPTPDPRPDPLAELSARELLTTVDAEVQRLPEAYRVPVILCCLEGRTLEEAARQLGWTRGSVKGRLERGRARLHESLARRGLMLSAVLAAVELSRGVAMTGVPAALVGSTARAALTFAAGQTAHTGSMSAGATTLAQEILRGALTARLKIAMALILVGSVAAAGAGLAARQANHEEQARVRQPESKPADTVVQKPRLVRTRRADAYGDPLPAEAVARLGTIRFRNADAFNSLAYTPDGHTLVSGGWGGGRVWDAVTGKEIRRFGGELPNPNGPAALSPDGKLVAVGGWGEETGGGVYELATGRRVSRFGSPRHLVWPACFSPNGKILAALDNWAIISLYNPVTGALLCSLEGHKGQLEALAFTPGGKQVLSTGHDGTVRLWDVALGKEVRRLTAIPGGVARMALSADGSQVALVGLTKLQRPGGAGTWFPNNRVHILDVVSGKEVRHFTVPTTETVWGRPMGPIVVAFTPDGKSLLTAGTDRALRVWDAATGKQLRHFTDHRGTLSALAVSPDGKAVALADAGKAVRVRDLATGRDLVPLGGHRDSVWAVVVSPDGQTAATAGWDRMIYVWDLATGRVRRRLAGHESLVRTLVYASSGRTLISAGYDRTPQFWDLATGVETHRLEGYRDARWLALAPDGSLLAVPARDEIVVLLDPGTGRKVRTLAGPRGMIIGASFSPDGRQLAAWSHDLHFHVWEVATGKHHERACRGLGDGTSAIAFSPGGRLVALGGQARSIPVVDLATGREVRQFVHRSESSDDVVSCLAFSPDGRTLAWGDQRDAQIRLGEMATGRERHRLSGHRGPVLSLAFSADGKRLVSGADDTTALVWDLTCRLGPGEQQPVALSESALASCWEDLRSEDGARAYTALRRLTDDPGRSVPLLNRRLRPVTVADGQHLARLIANLDSDRFAVREQATRELAEVGEQAWPDLRQALATNPSAEVRRRIRQVIGKEDLSPEALRGLRAVEVLEYVANPEAVRLLTRLTKGAAGARLTQEAHASLERLAKRADGSR